MHGLLDELAIIFLISIPVVFLFNKIKIPAIVGFLLTGMIIGPYGLKLIGESTRVETLSETGVILIMFSIGLEFSLSKLARIKKIIFNAGSIQVFATIALVFISFVLLGKGLSQSVFFGFLIALSSTAIVMKMYLSRAEIDSPQGKIALSILIFQDLIVLPMFLVTPILSGANSDLSIGLIKLLLTIIGIAAFIFVSIRYVMPFIIHKIAQTRIKELFFITILATCGLIVWLSALTGLSLALGAFIAGLIISETDFNYEALGFVEPFRDVFACFFFISVGMLLDTTFLFNNLFWVLSLIAMTLIIKIISSYFASKSVGASIRVSIIAAFSLAQIGEFSFVLSKLGRDMLLLDDYLYQSFLSASVLTIIITPFIFNLGYHFSNKFLTKENEKSKDKFEDSDKINLENHLIIIGYGIVGANIANAARFAGIPYITIELNPETVKTQRQMGEPIIYGDASNESLLHAVNIEKAKIVVCTIPDTFAEKIITKSVKSINPKVNLIIRTKFLGNMQELISLGADSVIPEELETSVELLTRVLNAYLIPRNDIELFIEKIRHDNYKMLRSNYANIPKIDNILKEKNYDISSVKISKKSVLIGDNIQESGLRKNFNIIILAIERAGELIPNPDYTTILEESDILILFGEREMLNLASLLFIERD